MERSSQDLADTIDINVKCFFISFLFLASLGSMESSRQFNYAKHTWSSKDPVVALSVSLPSLVISRCHCKHEAYTSLRSCPFGVLWSRLLENWRSTKFDATALAQSRSSKYLWYWESNWLVHTGQSRQRCPEREPWTWEAVQQFRHVEEGCETGAQMRQCCIW